MRSFDEIDGNIVETEEYIAAMESEIDDLDEEYQDCEIRMSEIDNDRDILAFNKNILTKTS